MADVPTQGVAAAGNGLFPAGTILSDSVFQAQTAQALAAKQLAENQQGQDWATTQYNFGMGSGASNPYGQQQTLNRSQQVGAYDQLNQAAKLPGGLRTGAYQKRQGNLVFSQGQQQDALSAAYKAAGLANTRNSEKITSGYNQSLYNAGLGALQRSLAATPIGDTRTPATPAAPAGAAPAGGPISTGTTRTLAPMGGGTNTSWKPMSTTVKPYK